MNHMNFSLVLCAALMCAGAGTVKAGTAGITGQYTGTHALIVNGDSGVLGYSNSNPDNAWSWDFDAGTASFVAGALNVGFPYLTGSVTLVDNGDGTYTGTYDVTIGSTTAATSTTWDITDDGAGNLEILTLDPIAPVDDGDDIIGTRLAGVLPAPVNLQWDGTANREQDIALAATTLDLGLVATGGTGSAALVVSNVGAIDLQLGAIAVVDPLDPPFSILDASGCVAPIPPGGSCSIGVQFAPATEGPFSDSFDIPSDDPDEPSVTVTVQGMGVAPQPDVALSAATLAFGEVVTGNSATRTVTVSNQGGSPLSIAGIALSGTDPTEFSQSHDCATLAAGASCTITVTFAPATAAAKAATLTITSDDPDEASVAVVLSGTGTAPVAGLTGRYVGAYSMFLWNATNNAVLGNSVPAGQNIPWTFDFDAGTVTIANAGLTTNVDYVISPSPTPLVRNADGTYAASYSIMIGDEGPGTTTTTWRITEADGTLTVTTLNADGDAIPGTTLPGVLPLPVGIVMDGTAVVAGTDSNGDGLTDWDALIIGLDPADRDGDTDGDGVSDVAEIGGDIANPLDTDGDGVIDAMEPGADATNGQVAAGLRIPAVGGTVTLTTEAGQTLSGVTVDTPTGGPGDVVFAHGAVSYVTTAPPGGTVRMRMSFSLAFPDKLVVYKVGANGTYVALPDSLWTRIDDHTLEVAVTDGDPLTDADGVVNGLIVDPVALGNDVRADFDFTDGGGGGCSLGGGDDRHAVEWLLVLLFLAWLGAGRLQYRLRRDGRT
ncbi:MAG: choice-of-anchor D domain-containing protein [Pseudomonadota bacterium]